MAKMCGDAASARREEIINACAALYETMNFKDVTLKEVGAKTSFTRTLIYYYFHTKEEIFLALLQREYEAWGDELDALCREHASMTAEQFAGAMSRSLERRPRLLKLLSMNHYDLEANSRMENLVAFKEAYGASMDTLSRCLEKFFPRMTAADIQGFLYAFFPFLFGIYPYTVVTGKQRAAMEQAGVPCPRLSVYELTRSMVLKLLRGSC